VEALLVAAEAADATVVITDTLSDFQDRYPTTGELTSPILDRTSSIDLSGRAQPTGLLGLRLVEGRVCGFASSQQEIEELCSRK
jgi:hypothetical protein